MSWPGDDDLTGFIRAVSQLRGDHPVFRRRRFFEGRGYGGELNGQRDIAWLTPAAEEMDDSDWNIGYARAVTVYLNGDAITEPDMRGQKVRDDSFLVLLNAHSESIVFRVPDESFGERWEVALCTASDTVADQEPVKAGDDIEVIDRGLLVLRRINRG